MDKSQIFGWVLIVALIGGFFYFESVSNEEFEKEQVVLAEKAALQAVEDSIVAAQRPAVEKVVESEVIDENIEFATSDENADSLKQVAISNALKSKFGIFSSAAAGEGKEVLLENNKVKLYINTKGGHISRAIAKNFKTYDAYKNDPVESAGELVLFSGDSSFYQLNFTHQNRSFNTRDFYFSPSKDGLSVTQENDEQTVKFKLNTSNGGYIEYVYSLKSDEYMIDFHVNIVNLDRDISGVGKTIEFQWEQVAPDQEKSLKLQRENATVFFYSDENGRDYLQERSDFDSEEPEDALSWLSFKQQYFSNVLLTKNEKITGSKLEVSYLEEDTTYVKKFLATFPMELSSNVSNKYQMYLGPNDYQELKKYDVHLEDQLNLGWGIFRWVNQYFIYPIFQWLLGVGMNVGIAIILLTFIIKLVLFPITYKNFLSSAKMRVIKPHLEKLNEENKNADPVKKQQATMALYKKTGVNPLAGCIPAVLQMPILIALYRLFPTALELRHQPFLWADDLSSFDSIYDFPGGFSIPVYGDHVSLFTILMAVSMFFYMRYNQQMTPTPSAAGGGDMQAAIQKNMKMMMNFMPVMMLFMFNEFASGLSFYYFLANVITIAQTLVIKKYIINEDKLLIKINEHMDKPMQKSKWQKKLEDIQAKQKGRK